VFLRWGHLLLGVVFAWALVMTFHSAEAAPEPAPPAAVAPEEAAAEAPSEVQFAVEVTPREVGLGAEVVYRATFEAAPGYRFYFPSPPPVTPFSLVPGSFQTTRTAPEEGQDETGTATTTVEFRLRSYRLGVRRVPAIDVPYLGPDGRTGLVALPRQRVDVLSALAEAPTSELAAPPAPRSIIATNWTLVWALVILGSVLGAMALTVLFVWLFRERLFRAPPPPPPRPAHEVALTKLAAIERERLPERGAVMEYYVRVSEAVREYLGARYGVDGLFMTTGELARALEPHDLQGVPLSRVRAFLEECDLVKFANFAPETKEVEWLLATAYGLVRETMKVMTAEEEERLPRPVAAAPPARPMARAFAWSWTSSSSPYRREGYSWRRASPGRRRSCGAAGRSSSRGSCCAISRARGASARPSRGSAWRATSPRPRIRRRGSLCPRRGARPRPGHASNATFRTSCRSWGRRWSSSSWPTIRTGGVSATVSGARRCSTAARGSARAVARPACLPARSSRRPWRSRRWRCRLCCSSSRLLRVRARRRSLKRSCSR
jgi:hypothetical protein